jgi:hypothetical protein
LSLDLHLSFKPHLCLFNTLGNDLVLPQAYLLELALKPLYLFILLCYIELQPINHSLLILDSLSLHFEPLFESDITGRVRRQADNVRFSLFAFIVLQLAFQFHKLSVVSCLHLLDLLLIVGLVLRAHEGGSVDASRVRASFLLNLNLSGDSIDAFRTFYRRNLLKVLNCLLKLRYKFVLLKLNALSCLLLRSRKLAVLLPLHSELVLKLPDLVPGLVQIALLRVIGRIRNLLASILFVSEHVHNSPHRGVNR